MRTRSLIFLLVLMLLTGCGEYQKLLKSKDPEVKWEAALTYFNQKKYVKAQTLLEDITGYYKGTPRAEDILAYMSRCHMGNKDYSSAAEYYATYVRNYPKGKYIAEARFQQGHCKYLDAPDPRLDQAITREAIESLENFVTLYPESPYADQAQQEIGELYDKLVYKEYLSAKLYYNLGTYLGNNYLSCELVAKNALKDYPGNNYQEELNWLILQAKYQQVLNSVEDKRLERARETQDECYNFITDYPKSKHVQAAQKINQDMRIITKE